MQFYLDLGIDHYLAQIDQNIGPASINHLKFFSERIDLECALQ